MLKINADYHIHTSLCKHAGGTMEEYVQQAIRLGLREIAFTDHIPLPDQFDIQHRMAEHELETYVRQVQALQTRFPEITILLGIEADFIDGIESYLERTLRRYPFDLVIMSVHFIKDWPQGQWVFKYDFPEKSLTEIYDEYLNAVIRGIQTGLFDIVGHLDLIKRPQQSLLAHNRTRVEEVLKLVRKNAMALEINTSGWRKEIGEPYPSLDFLPLIKEYGIPVTIGSDAHAPGQVGFGFDRLQKALATTSLKPIVNFKNRKIL